MSNRLDETELQWDFFISYTGVDEAWARWIAVELEAAGYSTVSQALDMRPGNDFAHMMQEASARARRTIAVLSPDYLRSRFGESEWRAAFRSDPTGERAQFVPVMVQECQPLGLLSTRIYIDLLDVPKDLARARLLAGLNPGQRPTRANYPPETQSLRSRFEGPARVIGPAISNLPRRNRNFTGRADMLAALRRRIENGGVAVVVPVEAIHGLGGVGKTELAIEYAYRFREDYEIIWWIPAEDPVTATSELAKLAQRIGVPGWPDDATMLNSLFEALCQRGKWLIIYDNAERPDWLDGLIPPQGDGNVIVTSRWAAWTRHADPLRLEVLKREESVTYLRQRIAGSSSENQLSELAKALGDLPLALEEAAAYIEATGVELVEYSRLVRERERELFGVTQSGSRESEGPYSNDRSIATTWSLALDRVRAENPAAEGILTVASFLAPDVPRSLLPLGAQFLPDALAAAVSDPLNYNRCLAALGRYSIATVGPKFLGIHRLVASVVRARLESSTEQEWARTAVSLVLGVYPADDSGLSGRMMAAELLPHVPVVVEHAERLKVAVREARWLLDRTTPPVSGQATAMERSRTLDGLVAAAVAGDWLARENLFVEIHPMVLQYCRGRLGRQESAMGSADDIAQEVCIAVISALPDYQVKGLSVRALVLGIAAQKVTETFRAIGRDRAEPVSELPDAPIEAAGPEHLLLAAELTTQLAGLLHHLTPSQREVLVLRTAVGLSVEETAQVVGSTPGAIRVVQHRALSRLRRVATLDSGDLGLDG